MNLSSVKNYSQENLQNIDFNLLQTKQPFEMSNTMENFIQFSENACQNENNFQASSITALTMHNRQVLKNTENKILPGSFTQLQPQSQVKTVGIEPLNQLGIQQTACSRIITESVTIDFSMSTFPPQTLLSVERKPKLQFPHSLQISSVLHQMLNESFKNP